MSVSNAFRNAGLAEPVSLFMQIEVGEPDGECARTSLGFASLRARLDANVLPL